MSMSRPVMKRSGTIFAVVMLATVLATGAAVAQDSRAGDASRFDQAQCLREAEHKGRVMLERLARAVRESQAVKELEAASAKVRDMLRDACAAGSVRPPRRRAPSPRRWSRRPRRPCAACGLRSRASMPRSRTSRSASSTRSSGGCGPTRRSRSSGCPGKVGTSFPTRTCAK
jgi:hypothetical protein